MTFLNEKIKATLWAVATGSIKSIRAMCGIAGLPYETARRYLTKLSKLKELYAQYVLEKYCPEDVAIVVIDPTYLKELREGIIVAGLLVPWLGRCIPLYWERFSWEEMEKEGDGLYSRNLFQGRFMRNLKKAGIYCAIVFHPDTTRLSYTVSGCG